jgi:1-acyl-sn-glycerol-3-phosphate acyltransferase
VGDTTLLASVWRTVCAKDLVAHVWCGLPDTAQGRDRRTWSDALRQDVTRLLDRPLTD